MVRSRIAAKYEASGAAEFDNVDGGMRADGGGATTASATGTATGTRATQITKPGAGTVIALILLPILMIAVGTVGKLIVEEETPAANVLA